MGAVKPARKKTRRHTRLSVSLDVDIAKKVHDLGFSERTSDSAIVELALLRFFKSDGPTLLRVALARYGVEPHYRKD